MSKMHKETKAAVVAVLASSGVVPAGTIAAVVQAANAAPPMVAPDKVQAQAKLTDEQTAIRAALHMAQQDGKLALPVTLAKNVGFILLYLVARRLRGTDTLPGGKLLCAGSGTVDDTCKLHACIAFRAAGGLLKGRTMQIGAPSIALTLLAGSGDKPLQAGGYQGCPAEYHRDTTCSYGRNAEDLLDNPDAVKAATVALLATGLVPIKPIEAKE